MNSKREGHAGKTSVEKRNYVESVLGSTAERADADSSSASTSNFDRSMPSGSTKRPLDWNFQVKNWFSNNIVSVAVTIIISLLGFLFFQVYSFNRELGIISTEVKRVEQIANAANDNNPTVISMESKLENLIFKVNELWDKVFRGQEKVKR